MSAAACPPAVKGSVLVDRSSLLGRRELGTIANAGVALRPGLLCGGNLVEVLWQSCGLFSGSRSGTTAVVSERMVRLESETARPASFKTAAIPRREHLTHSQAVSTARRMSYEA
jgi:hypothetical protein